MIDEYSFLASDDDLEKQPRSWLLAILSERRHLIISLLKQNAELYAEIEKLKDKQEQAEGE